jgi:glycosyltransferase involved in cell wall biosynthesis
VLQVIWSLSFGGAERVVMDLSEALGKERFDVHICCTNGKGVFAERMEAKGIPVHVLADAEWKPVYLSGVKLLRLALKERPAILHSHGTGPLLDSAFARLFSRVPLCVHTFHYGNYPYCTRKTLMAERLAARIPDQLVAVSNAQSRSLVQHLRIDPARIRTIWNGVGRNPHLGNQALIEEKKREMNLEPGDLALGTVAVFSEQKGLAYLLDSAKRVVESVPNARFILVGDGPLRPELEKKVRNMGLDSRVVFTGLRRDVQELLPAFDVFLMSSLWEGMALTLLEAMAAGKPVIATDVADNSLILKDGVTGYLVRPRDAAQMADAIIRLVSAPKAMEKMGQEALKAYNDRFTKAKMAGEYEKLYEQGLPKRWTKRWC